MTSIDWADAPRSKMLNAKGDNAKMQTIKREAARILLHPFVILDGKYAKHFATEKCLRLGITKSGNIKLTTTEKAAVGRAELPTLATRDVVAYR